MEWKNDIKTLDHILKIKKMNKQMIELQSSILSVVDHKESIESLLYLLQKHQIFNDNFKFHDFLILLNKISSTKYLSNEKKVINEIILRIKDEIVETFSKNEIFLFFKDNVAVLLCLYENKIIDFEQFSDYPSYELYHFFWPEYIENEGSERVDYLIGDIIKPYRSDSNQFCIDRLEYHSDATIAKLIRSDDIESFQNFIARTNLPLNSKIKDSIYEINSDIRNMCNSLIEYAAFFGSIKIFKFLFYQLDEMPKNVLLAASFGNNLDIIHLIEKKEIVPNQLTLYGSIISHRNELFDYLVSNYQIDLDFQLVDDVLMSHNYYVFNELLNRNSEWLKNINYINSIFSSVCCSNIHILFNILFSIPDLDVNIQIDIFIFF